jgi:hypothetical protein
MTTPGLARQNPLLRELQRVHDMLRHDLSAVRALAASIVAGAAVPQVRSDLARLRGQGPLFRLKADCLSYCDLVHRHHGGEDAGLFPVIRAAAPDLGPVVDRLEADHRLISDLLDDIEARARSLDDAIGPADRRRLAAALDTLSAHLTEHLAFEEESLAPVLQTWQSWPGA